LLYPAWSWLLSRNRRLAQNIQVNWATAIARMAFNKE
jgi:hypothetical protein